MIKVIDLTTNLVTKNYSKLEFEVNFFLQVVSKLCRSLESVFSHGLKANTVSALKQMTDLVSSNLGGFLTSATVTSVKPVMWNFVKVHLNRHELERYGILQILVETVTIRKSDYPKPDFSVRTPLEYQT